MLQSNENYRRGVTQKKYRIDGKEQSYWAMRRKIRKQKEDEAAKQNSSSFVEAVKNYSLHVEQSYSMLKAIF